jgi:soluble lytic murein transglycosylase-like protein
VGASRARQLARGIVFAARHFGVDPLLLAAIVRQESSFRAGVKACYLVKRSHASVPTCDYGLTQVNQVWVDHWGLEPERLVEDDAYALWFGARVLAILQREYAEDEDNWYSRYNSATPEPRAAYEAALEPLLAAANL